MAEAGPGTGHGASGTASYCRGPKMAEAGPGRGKRHRIIEGVFDFHDPSVGSTSTV